MPETILIDAQAGTLPEGFCPKGPTALQDLYNQFVASTQWSLAVGIRFFNYGDTEPTADFRGFPWVKTVGGFPDRIYDYASGNWLSLHQIPAGPSGFRCGWVGTPDELKIYDGGEVAVTSLYAGSFWEIDTDFEGRSPMGPGLIPGANPAKTLSVGENYGEGAHLQLPNELATHSHKLATEASITNADGSIMVVNTGAGGPGLQIGLTGPSTNPLTVQDNTYTAAQENMPVIHPVRGLHQIKRTIRKYYRGT